MYYTAFVPFQNLFCEYRESCERHDMQVLQYHDTFEIYLQTQGERYVFLNKMCYTLKPMDLYIVKPYEMHYCQSMDSTFYARYVLNFSDKKLQLLLTPMEHQLLMSKVSSGIYHLDSAHFIRICNIFKELLACLNQDGFLNEKLKYSLIMQILLLIREGDYMIPSHQENKITKNAPIMTALNYINAHYNETLHLDQIAQQVHMSKYHFCRQFKDAVGATFVEYVNSIRMKKAHQMLLETNLSLSDIAIQTGFSSNSQMTRAFRSFYQVTPSEFRKKHARTNETISPFSL